MVFIRRIFFNFSLEIENVSFLVLAMTSLHYERQIPGGKLNLKKRVKLLGICVSHGNQGVTIGTRITGFVSRILTSFKIKQIEMPRTMLLKCNYTIEINRFCSRRDRRGLKLPKRLSYLDIQYNKVDTVTSDICHQENERAMNTMVLPNSITSLNISHNPVYRVSVTNKTTKFIGNRCNWLKELKLNECILMVSRSLVYYGILKSKQRSIRHYQLVFGDYDTGLMSLLVTSNNLYHYTLRFTNGTLVMKGKNEILKSEYWDSDSDSDWVNDNNLGGNTDLENDSDWHPESD